MFVFAATSGGRAAAINDQPRVAVPITSQPPSLDPSVESPDWRGAPVLPLNENIQLHQPATERTTARVLADKNFLYVRFDAEQRETLVTTQRSNNVGDGTDDEVWVDLWPNDRAGFSYKFVASAAGVRYQYSSENTAFEPTWDARAVEKAGGYSVVLRIPLGVLHVAGKPRSWRAQFVRVVRATGETQVWSYGSSQLKPDEVVYGGVLDGLSSARPHPQPRVGVYALGSEGSPASGLSTSRLGVDLSIPLTDSASFYSTIHPDYSSVETDQQTIAPTAYARVYQEVRPFFTQGQFPFGRLGCSTQCPFLTELYTPNIPTPSYGYALEGKQGRLTFSALNAVGIHRNDDATGLVYLTRDGNLEIDGVRVAMNCVSVDTDCGYGTPYVHDDVNAGQVFYHDGKHIDAYASFGQDSGSNVQDASQAGRRETGFFYYTPTFGLGFDYQRIGFFYNPVDGLAQHPGIEGPSYYLANVWHFKKHAFLNAITAAVDFDRYRNSAGAPNQSDNFFALDILTSNRLDARLTTGSNFLLVNNCTDSMGRPVYVTPANFDAYRACQIYTPVSSNGLSVTWHSGTDTNPGNFGLHAAAALPATLSYQYGRFGPGILTSWQRSATLRLGLQGTVLAEADDTRQVLDAGGLNVSWLERVAYTYLSGRDSSVSFGVRRVVGTPPMLNTASPQSCTTLTSGACTGAWNITFAYHHRLPQDDFYFAYGDPSRLSTVPAFVFKTIHYFGAEKGT